MKKVIALLTTLFFLMVPTFLLAEGTEGAPGTGEAGVKAEKTEKKAAKTKKKAKSTKKTTKKSKKSTKKEEPAAEPAPTPATK